MELPSYHLGHTSASNLIANYSNDHFSFSFYASSDGDPSLHCEDFPLRIPTREELVFILVDFHIGDLREIRQREREKEHTLFSDQFAHVVILPLHARRPRLECNGLIGFASGEQILEFGLTKKDNRQKEAKNMSKVF